MKIEHVASRSEHPKLQLCYTNLVACCLGNQGRSPEDQHCDTSKDGKSLSKNPAVSSDRVQENIKYSLSSGKIFSKDKVFNEEINDVLHLNIDDLCRNRLDALQLAMDEVDKLPQNATKNRIQRILERWKAKDEEGAMEPYAGIVIYFLERLISRRK